MSEYDVIVVGGGPAGLSAALILARCRRRLYICDAGRPRNAASRGMHGYLTRDGFDPTEFLHIAREQLRPYDVEVDRRSVVDAACVDGGFEVVLDDGTRRRARKLLLATGLVDRVPNLEGMAEHYGRSVFHCPYCDGWEMRDQPLAVYGGGKAGLDLALLLTRWSGDLALCSDGPAQLPAGGRRKLARYRIAVREEPIARLEGADGVLQAIQFREGPPLPRRGMFLSTGHEQGSDLAAKLGCGFTTKGAVQTNRLEGTNVPGLYVAGDASRDVQLVIVAAAEGAKAGFAINRALMTEGR